MKVILTMDVPELGTRGERVEVKPGFARNYLIPRQLAVPATKGNLAIRAEEGRLVHVRERKEEREARRVAEFLAEHELFATLKIGREGRAFGAVTGKDLAVLLRQEGLEVDRRRIRLDAPIKRLGIFDVPIAIHSGVPTVAKVYVDREGGSKEGARAAQEAWNAEAAARAEAERLESEARAARAAEAEEAARVAIEKAAARKAREEAEAAARAEAEAKAREQEGAAAAASEAEEAAKAADEKSA